MSGIHSCASTGEFCTGGGGLWIMEQAAQGVCDLVRAELLRRQRHSHAQLFQASRIVGLVVTHGHDELRHAGGEGLGQGANAAMMHQSAYAGQ